MLSANSRHAEAEAALKSSRPKKISFSELAEDQNLLRAGDPNKKAIAVFYDSRIGTHSEYLDILAMKQTFERLSDYEVLLIDLAAKENSADEAAKAS